MRIDYCVSLLLKHAVLCIPLHSDMIECGQNALMCFFKDDNKDEGLKPGVCKRKPVAFTTMPKNNDAMICADVIFYAESNVAIVFGLVVSKGV